MLLTDLSKMADGPDEGKALLGHKVTKPLELEGFRYRTVRTGRTSGRGLGAGTRESMGCELYEPPKSILCAPAEKAVEGVLGHVGRIT